MCLYGSFLCSYCTRNVQKCRDAKKRFVMNQSTGNSPKLSLEYEQKHVPLEKSFSGRAQVIAISKFCGFQFSVTLICSLFTDFYSLFTSKMLCSFNQVKVSVKNRLFFNILETKTPRWFRLFLTLKQAHNYIQSCVDMFHENIVYSHSVLIVVTTMCIINQL